MCMWRTVLLILSALGVAGVAVGAVGHYQGWWHVPLERLEPLADQVKAQLPETAV